MALVADCGMTGKYDTSISMEVVLKAYLMENTIRMVTLVMTLHCLL